MPEHDRLDFESRFIGRRARLRAFGESLLDSLTLRSTVLSFREALVASSFILIFSCAIYGWYVAHGGFYSDDWGNAWYYRFADPPRYLTSVAHYNAFLGGRPILALLLPVPHALFGLHPELHLAFALGVTSATAICFYVLLRTLAVAPLHSGAVTMLFLLFPWSDSIRLWSTASLNSIAVIFFLVGLTIGLRTFETRGRIQWLMRGTTMVLFALSVLTYQVCAAAIVLGGFFYLRRTDRRQAVTHWLLDIAAVTVALAYSYVATLPARHVATVGERLHVAPRTAREAVRLFALALTPFGSSTRLFEGLVALAAGALLVVSALRLRRSPEKEQVYWVTAAAVAIVGIASAYFMILNDGTPLAAGIGNRSNVFAALPYAVLVYAVVLTGASTLIPNRRAASLVAVAYVLAVAGGYGARLGKDESAWARAAGLQQHLLATVDSVAPRLPRHSSVLTFAYPAETAPGVPVFARTWDLNAALSLRRDDPTLVSDPVFDGIGLRCNSGYLEYRTDYSLLRLAYGRLFLVDASRRELARIVDAASCQRALERFRPGPLIAPQ